jgi:hypothetical protein
MRFNLLSDANWESKVDKVLDSLSNFGYRDFLNKGRLRRTFALQQIYSS